MDNERSRRRTETGLQCNLVAIDDLDPDEFLAAGCPRLFGACTFSTLPPVYLRALRVLMQRERRDARWGLGVRRQPAFLTTATASMAQSLVAALFFPASDGAATGTAARRR